MYALGKCPDYRSIIIKCVRLYSLARKNHYDVLKLRKNCSDKEIKEAFIQMSKEYHPDKNKDAKAQDMFVRIVEAYNILSKPSSRAQYDNVSEISTNGSSYASYVYRPSPYTCRNGDYNYYYETAYKRSKNGQSTNTKNTDQKVNNENYYGFAGLKRLPNYYIIGICFGIAFFGVVLQVYVISLLFRSSIEVRHFRNMYVRQREQAREKSMQLALELERVRAAARENGNELQTRRLLDKIVANANPTVVTASLGQALADEKKHHVDSLLTEFGVGESAQAWYDPRDSMKESWYDLKFMYETWCQGER